MTRLTLNRSFIFRINSQIDTFIEDYGSKGDLIGKVNYEQLRSGEIEFMGRRIHTAPLSSLYKARRIAAILKEWIEKGEFELTAPVRPMPVGTSLKGLQGD